MKMDLLRKWVEAGKLSVTIFKGSLNPGKKFPDQVHGKLSQRQTYLVNS